MAAKKKKKVKNTSKKVKKTAKKATSKPKPKAENKKNTKKASKIKKVKTKKSSTAKKKTVAKKQNPKEKPKSTNKKKTVVKKKAASKPSKKAAKSDREAAVDKNRSSKKKSSSIKNNSSKKPTSKPSKKSDINSKVKKESLREQITFALASNQASASIGLSECRNCGTESKCRRRTFSEKALVVLLLWKELAPSAVDGLICDDCYNEMREILIERTDEIDHAMQQSDEVEKIKKRILVSAS